MKEIKDIRDLIEAVMQTLWAAGFSEAGKFTGFVVEQINHGTQVRVGVRVGRHGNSETELQYIIKRYREALVYADRFNVLDSSTIGNPVKSLIVEAREPEAPTAPLEYTLHQHRDSEGTLTVKIDGEPVSTIVYTEGDKGTGWTFPGDPSRSYWGKPEWCVTALLIVRNLRQVLKHHVDEEDTYEKALLTALAGLSSRPERTATGRVKIRKR